MQNIKPSDMTKLEEYRLWLSANGEHDTKPSPVETGHLPLSVSPSRADNSAGNTSPSSESLVNTFSEQ
jgi:hypothetical protein